MFEIKHYGDVTKIDGSKIEQVDIVTFGAPCQDLSVAGGRKGMKNVAKGDEETTRSGLFYEAIRIIKEMRDESFRQLQLRGSDVDLRRVRPRFAVYENVPGAFSSNKGEDFRCVLEETARIVDKDAVIPGPPKGKWTPSGCVLGDGWSIAWRVHDAQFWGVPQRRKRISLVADFGGQSAPEILFERKSLQRNTDESEKKGQETAGAVGTGSDTAISFQERAGCEGGGKGILIQNERTASIRTQCNQYCLGFNRERIGAVTMEDKCPTIQAAAGESGNNQPMVVETVCLEGNGSRPSHKGDGYKESDIQYTLNSTEVHGVCSYQEKTGALLASGYDKLGTQEAVNDMYVVTQRPKEDSATCYGQGSFGNYKEGFGTLKANGGDIGGGERISCNTVGALCARDWKGVGSQYVNEGKCIVQSVRKS